MIKKISLIITALLTMQSVFASGEYVNDLRNLFLSNKAIIMAINLRTFNAKDLDNSGIIEEGEERGTFLNAIERLDELKQQGVNVLHVLPINPIGKLKALGTAGSVYSPFSLTEINPMLADNKSTLSVEEQARLFVSECHRRGIRVIVDLPSCGSYDMYLDQPDLFVKDKSMSPVVPTDWTDVRLFDAGVDGNLNQKLYDIHVKYIDMVQSLGFDGVRADVATIKPSEFWKNLISYARAKDSNFLFLAEASDSWREPPSEFAVFTPYDRLLAVGFDGYYGSYFNIKDWSKASDLINHVNFNKKFLSGFSEPKSVIGSFTTHDELSPILIKGEKLSNMIIWLNTTLPLNSYYVDGFQSGADYVYFWGNKKAPVTYTDDDYYFVHRGKFDLFNYSARPKGTKENIGVNFEIANRYKKTFSQVFSKGSFIPVSASDDSVFAYVRSYGDTTILVVGNLDFKNGKMKVKIEVPKLNASHSLTVLKGSSGYGTLARKKDKIVMDIPSGDIQVYLINNLSL